MKAPNHNFFSLFCFLPVPSLAFHVFASVMESPCIVSSLRDMKGAEETFLFSVAESLSVRKIARKTFGILAAVPLSCYRVRACKSNADIQLQDSVTITTCVFQRWSAQQTSGVFTEEIFCDAAVIVMLVPHTSLLLVFFQGVTTL